MGTWFRHLPENNDVGAMAQRGPLTEAQIEAFLDDGFLVMPDFYGKAALREVQSDVEGMVDRLGTRAKASGVLEDTHAGLDWTTRLLRIREEFPDAPVVLIKGGVLPPALQRVMADERILDIASQLGLSPGP
eukprot:gene2888-3475_t